jgi:hypothetical protein
MVTTTPHPTSMKTTTDTIDFWPAQSMAPMKDHWQGLRCRFINALPVGPWDDFILSDWELEACAW